MRPEPQRRGLDFWVVACAFVAVHVNLLAWSITRFHRVIFHTTSLTVHGLLAVLVTLTWLGTLGLTPAGRLRGAHNLLYLPTVISMIAIVVTRRREAVWVGSLSSLIALLIAYRLADKYAMTGNQG